MAAQQSDVDEFPATKTGLAELSLDAALELGSLLAGRIGTSASFQELIQSLRDGRVGQSGDRVSMLADTRRIALLRRATHADRSADRAEAVEAIDAYLNRLLQGVSDADAELIAESKRLCLALNREILASDHEKLTSRRWRQEYAA